MPALSILDLLNGGEREEDMVHVTPRDLSIFAKVHTESNVVSPLLVVKNVQIAESSINQKKESARKNIVPIPYVVRRFYKAGKLHHVI
jgi:hypothetical protein